MTLNCYKFEFSRNFAWTTAKRMKIDLHCQRQNCSPLNLLFAYTTTQLVAISHIFSDGITTMTWTSRGPSATAELLVCCVFNMFNPKNYLDVWTLSLQDLVLPGVTGIMSWLNRNQKWDYMYMVFPFNLLTLFLVSCCCVSNSYVQIHCHHVHLLVCESAF